MNCMKGLFKTIKEGITYNQTKSCIKMLNIRYILPFCKRYINADLNCQISIYKNKFYNYC